MYHREPGGRKTECAPLACNFSIIANFVGDTQREPLRRGEILLERLSITFTSNGKRELVGFFFTCRLLFIISTPK